MKKVLVLGGSKGLGLACVEKLLSTKKYEVIILSRSSPKPELPNVRHIATDFSSKESLVKSLSSIKDNQIYAIINNSGGPKSKPFQETSLDDLELGLTSHLLAAHQVVLTFVKGMIERGEGRIVNIVSVTAKNPLPNMIVSNTVRGAMLNWSKTLSKELGSSGITVNCILPGYTETERLSEVITSVAIAKNVEIHVIEKKLISEIPAGRFGKPDELASLAAFLISDEANYINGQAISVDGGWLGCN